MLFKKRCISVKKLMERGIPKLEKNIVAGVVVKTSRDWGVCVCDGPYSEFNVFE
jgi:hypothetical protein